MSSDESYKRPLSTQVQLPISDMKNTSMSNDASQASSCGSADNEDAAAVIEVTASESSDNGSAPLAAEYETIDTLEHVYGFPSHIARRAVDVVGADFSACYNYILDQGLAQDQGGPVFPITDCPHVSFHVLLESKQLPTSRDLSCSHPNANVLPASLQQQQGNAKSDSNTDGSCPSQLENWICLQCGVVRCSRYINAHAVDHFNDTLDRDPGEDGGGHCVHLSLADLSVWCHSCQAYLVDPVVQQIVAELQERFDLIDH